MVARAARLCGLETAAAPVAEKRHEVELEVADIQIKHVDLLFWERAGWIGSGGSTSGGRRLLDVLEIKPERRGQTGMLWMCAEEG